MQCREKVEAIERGEKERGRGKGTMQRWKWRLVRGGKIRKRKMQRLNTEGEVEASERRANERKRQKTMQELPRPQAVAFLMKLTSKLL